MRHFCQRKLTEVTFCLGQTCGSPAPIIDDFFMAETENLWYKQILFLCANLHKRGRLQISCNLWDTGYARYFTR